MALLERGQAADRLARVSVAIDLVLYALLRLTLVVLRPIPLAVLRPMLEGIARAVAVVDRKHARIARRNLAIAYPHADPAFVARTVHRAFRNWGRVVAELVHSKSFTSGQRPDWVAQGETIVRSLPASSGLLVLTAHTANVDLLARVWAATTGREIAVFHRPFSNRFLERYMRRERARSRVSTLGRGPAVREALRVLARGGIVAVPLDQNQPPGRPGVFVDFFGKPAATSTVLARLALASGAPVVSAFAQWEGPDLSAVLGRPTRQGSEGGADRGGRGRAIAELTAGYTAQIEAAVRRRPEQWNWVHQRWKTRPQ